MEFGLMSLATSEGASLAHAVNAGGLRLKKPAADACSSWERGDARSHKENGVDFVLRRFLVGHDVSAADLRRMGVGGLLSEIATRPQLRQATTKA